MPMRDQRDYDLALRVVGEQVAAWDPYGLLEGGAPKDEFDAEIAKLVTWIPKIRSPGDATEAVARVFSDAFETEHFRRESCREMGEALFSALKVAGLL